MRTKMKKSEIGRVSLGKIKLIEYDMNAIQDHQAKFFIQSGIAGFYASDEELRDLYGILSYYFNIDQIENLKIDIE